MSDLAPLFTGFALTAGLIVAIGGQNAFVLRQGLRREHAGPVALFCATVDLALVSAGVAGLGAALEGRPGLVRWLALGGATFLAWYGLTALGRAARPGRLVAEAAGAGLSLGGALARAAGFTLLNPHVYLDTVLLLGSVGAAQVARAALRASGGLARAGSGRGHHDAATRRRSGWPCARTSLIPAASPMHVAPACRMGDLREPRRVMRAAASPRS